MRKACSHLLGHIVPLAVLASWLLYEPYSFPKGSITVTSKLLRTVVKIVWIAWNPGECQGKQGSARRPRGFEMARRTFPPSYSRIHGPHSSPSAGLHLYSMAVHKTLLTTGLLIAFYINL